MECTKRDRITGDEMQGKLKTHSKEDKPKEIELGGLDTCSVDSIQNKCSVTHKEEE